MADLKWGKDLLEEAKTLKEQGLDYHEMARRFNADHQTHVSASAINHALNDYLRSKGDHTETKSIVGSNEIEANGNQKHYGLLALTEQQKKDPDYMLEAHGFDHTKWTVVNVKNNIWEQHSTQDGTVPLYQSTIIAKPSEDGFSKILAHLNDTVKPLKFPVRRYKGNNLVLPVVDTHFPILTFDMLKAKLEGYVDIMSKGYNEISLFLVGDLFHSASIKSSRTEHDTQLQDVNMFKAWEYADSFFNVLISNAIQYSNKVTLHATDGNHDASLQWAFVKFLEARYPQVEVLDEHGFRTAFQIGKVAFLLSHGDTAKQRLPMLFATEYPKIWAASKYRYIIKGHFHQELTKDDLGVVSMQLGTYKPSHADSYEMGNGFDMSSQQLYALELDNERMIIEYHI